MSVIINRDTGKKPILLIGCNGMLGRHFQDYYKEKFTFLGISRASGHFQDEAISIETLSELIGNTNIDILYFASNFTNRKLHYDRTAFDNEINMATRYSELIEESFNLKKLIFVSTGGGLYQHDCGLELDESTEINLNDFYKKAKVEVENLFFNKFKNNSSSLRVSNIFGSSHHISPSVGFVDNLVKLNNRHFEKPVSSVTKDWIHIDEVCASIEKIISIENQVPNIINVGTGVSYDILDIYKSYIYKDLSCLKPIPDGYRLGLNRLNSLGIYPSERLRDFLKNRIIDVK